MHTLLFLAMQAVSYQRDVAPVLAFHCHRCHGDESAAGGLDTRSLQSLLRGGNLGPAVVAGAPARGTLLEFLEGRRGPQRRMPLEAPPLPAAVIENVRTWIAQGAVEDPASPPFELRGETRRRDSIVIRITSPVKAYAELEAAGGLYRGAAVIDGSHEWKLRAPRSWPRRIKVVLRLRYAQGNPQGARLSIE
jgi:hypothetical protein